MFIRSNKKLSPEMLDLRKRQIQHFSKPASPRKGTCQWKDGFEIMASRSFENTNPVCGKPAIERGNNHYFCDEHHAMQENLSRESLARIMGCLSKDANMKKKAQKQEVKKPREVAERSEKKLAEKAQSKMLQPDVSLLVKLGSIAVHAEELMSPDGHAFDKCALQALLGDQEVKAWISEMNKKALVPRMRKIWPE